MSDDFFKTPTSTRPHFRTDEDLLVLTPRQSRRYRRGFGISGRQFRIEVRRQRKGAKMKALAAASKKVASKRKSRAKAK